jgi:type I restriction enzyme S subunit
MTPDVAASVRARLLAVAKQTGEEFERTLVRFAAERWLYRLGQSNARERCILKGAALLGVWLPNPHRATRDVDLLGSGPSDDEAIAQLIREVSETPCDEDGLVFDLSELTLDPIREEAAYAGVRALFLARLGSARIRMQVDFGFGDAVANGPEEIALPVMLSALPSTTLRAYPREQSVAEKFEAMVKLDVRNSRMKDFHDIWAISDAFAFDGERLREAVAGCFARRGTHWTDERPAVLTLRFYGRAELQARWSSYLSSGEVQDLPPHDFAAIGERMIALLGPVRDAIVANGILRARWSTTGVWERVDDSETMSNSANDALRGDLRHFRAYPRYKDSRLEWLGEIPMAWEVKRLKEVATLQMSNVDKKSVEGEQSVELCNYTDVYYQDHISSDIAFMKATAPREQIRRFALRAGDVLITKDSESWTDIAVPAVVDEDLPNVLCGYHLAHIRPRPAVYGPYLARAISAVGLRDQFRVSANGVTRFAIGTEAIATSAFPIPSMPEQRAIATFLDRETARIDALAAKYERLITLMQERRTALITRAVTKSRGNTKGSCANDSLVFPEVPAGWTLVKLRRLLDQVHRPIRVEDEAEYREIGIRSWGRGIFHKDPVKGVLLEEKSIFSVEPGDFVLNIVFAWEGAVAIASEGERGMVGSHRFPTFRIDRSVVPDYLLMVLQTAQGRSLMEVTSPGAAGRNRTIRLDQFLAEEIPLPPLAEQKEIVRSFRAEEARLATLEARTSDAITRLHEFRTALISAAATGKIDVREADQ